ncbi:MAG TPA: serine hydrolase domain-containing protein [Vicinamibacterales bacterium]|nr:serine hydrolase domain-containing protein [Vicinamibacterales bacterium]
MRVNRLLLTLPLALVLFVGVPVSTAPPRGQAAAATATLPDGIALSAPESVGFSGDSLKELDNAMQGIVDARQLAGVVTLVARHGKVVQHKAYGVQDIATQAPMRLDTIVRIYSMTKPIAGAAMMMLYEEGKWLPGDPIAKHIPEFANLKVFSGMDANGQPILVAPNHPPTMGELMSHNAGFTYGLFGNSAVDKIYQAEKPLDAPSLQAFVDKMAKMPLLYQPGEKWVYSVSVDIQGYLVQKLSGKTFPDFLRDRIFTPLGMKDTEFFVPAAKLSRVSTIYSWDMATRALKGAPHDPGIGAMPGLPSGGGGLYSTAADYFRFAQMMLNGGELNGTRLLKNTTVAMMRTNVLNDQTLNSKSGIGPVHLQPGLGFGYDFAVMSDPAALKSPLGKGSYWWWGIAGTWFWNDPTNDLLFIGMIQRRGGVPGAANHEDLARAAVYKALVDPAR